MSAVQTSVRFVLYGELASKANSRKLVTIGGKPRFIKSAKALSWDTIGQMQVRPEHRLGLAGPIRFTAHIYYASRRPDLDPSLLMDVLEKAGVYLNDRQIVEQHLYKGLDKKDPRVEVLIEELTP